MDAELLPGIVALDPARRLDELRRRRPRGGRRRHARALAERALHARGDARRPPRAQVRRDGRRHRAGRSRGGAPQARGRGPGVRGRPRAAERAYPRPRSRHEPRARPRRGVRRSPLAACVGRRSRSPRAAGGRVRVSQCRPAAGGAALTPRRAAVERLVARERLAGGRVRRPAAASCGSARRTGGSPRTRTRRCDFVLPDTMPRTSAAQRVGGLALQSAGGEHEPGVPDR